MRVGIAVDHGGYCLKAAMLQHLAEAGHEVVDFGASRFDPLDDFPDYLIPLSRAVASGRVARGVGLCGSGVGASIVANKIPGVRAALILDTFSARQGVEDDHMNVICLGGRIVGGALAWELVSTFLLARPGQDERFLRRLAKIQAVERTEQAKGV